MELEGSVSDLSRYQLGELLAVTWTDEMAQRFPNADHAGCRALMDPATQRVTRCIGWHCNRCGAPTNSYGHHDCPDRPEVRP